MAHYIDKDALLERIKKLKMDIGNIFNEYDEGFWEGRTTAFDDVICALDIIEVKEVDLEKELDEWVKYGPHTNYPWCTIPDAIKITAEHFFELGIKAQKGEEV